MGKRSGEIGREQGRRNTVREEFVREKCAPSSLGSWKLTLHVSEITGFAQRALTLELDQVFPLVSVTFPRTPPLDKRM